jgi:hypothetical protein
MADEQKPDEPKPELPGGIGETEFNIWKHLPVTRAYLKYLADLSEDTKAAAVAGWIGGKLQIATADELRGRALTLSMAAAPDFAAIVGFYDELKTMEQAEQEANDPDLAEVERVNEARPGPRRTKG